MYTKTIVKQNSNNKTVQGFGSGTGTTPTACVYVLIQGRVGVCTGVRVSVCVRVFRSAYRCTGACVCVCVCVQVRVYRCVYL